MFALDFTNGQAVAVGASSSNTTAFTTSTFLFLSTSTDCWVNIGAGADATADTAGNLYMAAGSTLRVMAPSGSRVAVIQDSAGGFLTVMPILNT